MLKSTLEVNASVVGHIETPPVVTKDVGIDSDLMLSGFTSNACTYIAC